MASCEAVDIQAQARLRARAECRPTLQIVVYPDVSQREWLHAVAAARKSPSTSSCVSIDNTLPTARATVPMSFHRSFLIHRAFSHDGWTASWTLLPAHPPRRGLALGFSASVSGLWCCFSAAAGVAAHDDERRGCASVRPNQGGAIRSTREAGICELSKLAEGS